MQRPERRDTHMQKFESPNAARTVPNDRRNKINQESALKKEAPPCKPNGPGRPKPLTGESSYGRPKPPTINNVMKDQRNTTLQKKPTPHQREVHFDFKQIESAYRVPSLIRISLL